MRMLAVGWLLAAAVVVVSAPVPKDLAPLNYFPSALGSRWEYALEGETEAHLTIEVTQVQDKDGVRTILIEQTGGAKTRDYPEQVRIGPEGIHLLSAAENDITPPRLDLRPKPKANDEWEGPHSWKNINYTCLTTVGDFEKVTVPAGTYTALPHTQKYGLLTNPQVWTAWYAPSIGRVKFINYERQVHVLLKYTPGKEAK